MKHRTETQHRNAHRHAQRLSNTPDHVRSHSITRGHGCLDTRSHSFGPIHNQFRPDHSPTETEHRETERENMRELPARSRIQLPITPRHGGGDNDRCHSQSLAASPGHGLSRFPLPMSTIDITKVKVTIMVPHPFYA